MNGRRTPSRPGIPAAPPSTPAPPTPRPSVPIGRTLPPRSDVVEIDTTPPGKDPRREE